MEIIKVKISDITPYENNVKQHPQSQIDQIKSSIVEFGNNDPIALDENYVIIEGHGRLEALKELGYDEAECIIIKGLNEEQKNAYRLVHNKLTMNSDFDLEALNIELEKIRDIDMTEFDFTLNDDDIPDEIELPREEIGGAHHMKSIKYGSSVIHLTEEEDARFKAFYDKYLNTNGNVYGLVGELLENGDANYAD